MLTWPPTAIRTLRRTIAAVDATVRGAGSGRTTADRREDVPHDGRDAVDLASRLRRLAAELRWAADDVPCYGLLAGLCGLPRRADVDAAAATLEAIADALLTSHGAASRDFAVRVARLLGLAPEVAGRDG